MRPRAKVTIDSLYEVVYEKSIGTKINDLDFRLEVVSMSCQPLRYIRRRKPLDVEVWLQWTTIGNGLWETKCSRDPCRHVTPTVAVRQYGRLS